MNSSQFQLSLKLFICNFSKIHISNQKQSILHSIDLHTEEQDVLIQLENQTGIRLVDLDEEPMAINGFSLEGNRVGEIRILPSYFDLSKKVQSLPKNFGVFEELHTLDLSFNYLSELPQSFSNLISLEKLYLDANNFHFVPDELTNLPELRQLNLDYNKITILPEFTQRFLNSIRIAGNRIIDFPEHLSDLRYLRRLVLHSNQISDFDVSYLTKFTYLHRLDLRRNAFSQGFLDEIIMFCKIIQYRNFTDRVQLGNLISPFEELTSDRSIIPKITTENDLLQKAYSQSDLNELKDRLYKFYL